MGHLLRRAALFRAKVLLHFGILLVLQQLARRVQLVAGAPISFIGLDDLSQRALLAREPGQLLVIDRDLGSRHLRFDLAVAPRNRFKAVHHSAFTGPYPSPRHATMKD